jgi:type IX secretion system substrate protein
MKYLKRSLKLTCLIGILWIIPITVTLGQTLQYLDVFCGLQQPLEMVLDDSGNVYITGMLKESVDFDPGPGVSMAYWNPNFAWMYLAKYAPNGSFVWGFTLPIGQSLLDDVYPYALAVDNAGSVYVSGVFTENGLDMDHGPGSYIIATYNPIPPYTSHFYAKYNNTGQLSYAYGLGTISFVSSIVTDDDCNVYLSGCTDDDVDFAPPTINVTVEGQKDRCLIKTDSSSNVLWVKVFYGKSGFDCSSRIAMDSNGDLVVASRLITFHDFDADSAVVTVAGSYHPAWIAKYDTSGSFIWVKILLNNQNSTCAIIPTKIVCDNKSNIFVVGSYLGQYCDFNPDSTNIALAPNNGLNDVFISSYDSNGNFRWVATNGSAGEEQTYSMSINDDGYSFWSCTSFNDSIDVDPSTNVHYIFQTVPQSITPNQENYTIVLDSLGQFVDVVTIAGDYHQSHHLNGLMHNGDLILAGGFQSPVDFDPGPAVVDAGACALGYFIVNYGSQFVGVEEYSIVQGLTVYPNPTTQSVSIEFTLNKTEHTRVELYNIHGKLQRVLFNKTPSGNQIKINEGISDLANGIYFLSVQTGSGKSTVKFVKM